VHVRFLNPTKSVLQRWLQAGSELTGTSALKVPATVASVANRLQSVGVINLWKTRNVVDIGGRIVAIENTGDDYANRIVLYAVLNFFRFFFHPRLCDEVRQTLLCPKR
jgi:hypothetical protein